MGPRLVYAAGSTFGVWVGNYVIAGLPTDQVILVTANVGLMLFAAAFFMPSRHSADA
jgi:hypothetical protein